MIFVLVLLFSLASAAEPGREHVLEPVVARGTPSDLWFTGHAGDAPTYARPLRIRNLGATGGRASLASDLATGQPLGVSTTGHPGAVAGLRGIGRSAEETTVSMLGVPLNPVSGGGFDLGAMPSYLWEEATWYPGGGSILTERGTAGGLVLSPWTTVALRSGQRGQRLTLGVSDPRSITLSGGVSGEEVAAVAGVTSGDASGPGGMVSVEHGAWSAHLLASSLDARVVTPYASASTRQKSARAVPVLQWESHPSASLRARLSTFADVSYLAYEDPADPYSRTRDHAQQWGASAAIRNRNGQGIYASLRHAGYRMLTQALPNEISGQIAVQDEWIWESTGSRVELETGLTGHQRLGVFPVGSIGWSKSGANGVRIRGGFAVNRRFPSLLDRAYVLPFVFEGNPSLRSELNASVRAGMSVTGNRTELSLDLIGSRRWGAILTDSTGPISTVVNRGRADQLVFMPGLEWAPGSGLELSGSFVVSRSRVEETRAAFPYLSPAQHRLRLGWSGLGRRVGFGVQSRASLRRPLGTVGRELPGYGLWDVDFRWVARHNLTVSGGFENLGDRAVEFTAGLPSVGRIAALNLIAEL